MPCVPAVIELVSDATSQGIIRFNRILTQPELPEFSYNWPGSGLVELVDIGVYRIIASIPVNSDCGIPCQVNLQIGNVLKSIVTSTGGERILHFLAIYNKDNNDTEEVKFTFYGTDSGGFTQGSKLRVEKEL